jgi:hypothetical protein
LTALTPTVASAGGRFNDAVAKDRASRYDGGGTEVAPVNQALLRKMATERIQDAQVLLAGGRWPFAYYVAGYAVGCALKSCFLARMVQTGWPFQEGVKIIDCRTHDFNQLVDLAGLRDDLNAAHKASTPFAPNWAKVVRWTETSRYDDTTTETHAREFISAIVQDPDGVLPWLSRFW